MTPPAPLEDDFTWVTRKALKVFGLAPAAAAHLARLDPAAVLAFSRGNFSRDVALALAPVLDLDPAAFAALPLYQPVVPDVPGLTRLEFAFGDGSVNAWLVQCQDHALLIDSGPDPAACANALRHAAAPPVLCLVTHGHRDHIAGLAGLGSHCRDIVAPASDHIPGARSLTAQATLAHGPLQIRAIDLDGHSRGALGYVIEGLSTPLCAVGDALFAGSVGGTADLSTHRRALDLLRRHVLSLPPQTILLPGHGPATTVAQERVHNPFLAHGPRHPANLQSP